MNNVINWFEIPVAEMDRAVAFYEPVMQVALRREKMDCIEMVPFSRMRIRLLAARWQSSMALSPPIRDVLSICILTIWRARSIASTRRAEAACLAPLSWRTISARLPFLLIARVIGLAFTNPRK